MDMTIPSRSHRKFPIPGTVAQAATGVYEYQSGPGAARSFVRLQAAGETVTRKVVFVGE
jgi:hypothetical protein